MIPRRLSGPRRARRAAPGHLPKTTPPVGAYIFNGSTHMRHRFFLEDRLIFGEAMPPPRSAIVGVRT